MSTDLDTARTSLRNAAVSLLGLLLALVSSVLMDFDIKHGNYYLLPSNGLTVLVGLILWVRFS